MRIEMTVQTPSASNSCGPHIRHMTSLINHLPTTTYCLYSNYQHAQTQRAHLQQDEQLTKLAVSTLAYILYMRMLIFNQWIYYEAFFWFLVCLCLNTEVIFML